MSNTLEAIIFEALDNCGRKKGDVAAGMGVPLSTLSRETSPYDQGAKLGVASLIPFMRETRSLAPLDYILDQFGLRAVPKLAAPDGEDMRDESLQAYGAAHEFIKDANDQAVPYRRLAQGRRQVAKEMDDLLELRRPEGETQGFLVGHFTVPGGCKTLLMPNEEPGEKQ